MPDSTTEDDLKIAELRAIVESIRDRVRSQYPSTSVVADSGGPEPIRVPVADLMPIVHARDAAQAKMAAIGSVNPRAGGFANDSLQSVKRAIARALNWFVRDQIVFNRGALACIEAAIESMNDLNRALASLAAQIDGRLQLERQSLETRLLPFETRVQETSSALGDFAQRWNRSQSDLAKTHTALNGLAGDLRVSFEKSVGQFEARSLAHEKSYADLAAAMRSEFAQLAAAQHAAFTSSLAQASLDMRRQFDRDLEQIKFESERVIHNELRVVRQRGVSAQIAPAPEPFDYQAFSDRFRGSEAHVLENQRFYANRFHGDVLDIGCGHGEFLEVMRESGVNARGIDRSPESVAYCRSKGLAVEQADLFAYLDSLPGHSLDGIFSSQVVEHLPGSRIPEMIQLCAAKLRADGLLAVETPNPECLAIFATHFYLDPTHVRPVPSALLAFYMQENGLGGIEVHPRFPAADSFPELNELPEGVRNRFFGGLDYAIFARRL